MDKRGKPCRSIGLKSAAIYNLLGNEKFDRDEIIKAHRNGTIKRMAGEPVILAVQDTTGVNYDDQRNMEGNGYISDKTMGVNTYLLNFSQNYTYNRNSLSCKELSSFGVGIIFSPTNCLNLL
jgi:hypothetical protein